MTRLFPDLDTGSEEQPELGFSGGNREAQDRGALMAPSEPPRAAARAGRGGEPARAEFFRSKRRPVLPVLGLVGAVATIAFFLWLGRDEDPPPAPELAPVAAAPGPEAPIPAADGGAPSPGSFAAAAESDPSLAPPATLPSDVQAGAGEAAAPAQVAALAEPAPPAAAKPAPAAARQPEAAPVLRNAFSVQLLAAHSEADVGASWERLRGAHPDLLASLSPTVARTDRAPGDTLYRLRAGPLPDRSAADALCKALGARQQACFVVPPGS